MKIKTFALLTLVAALSACGGSRRYDVLPEPPPGPIPTPRPTPGPQPPAPVPVPQPSPEEPNRDGAMPAALFAPLLEGTATFNDVSAVVGVGLTAVGNPDQSGTYWYIWPKVDCGTTVLYAMLGFKPRPGTQPVPANFVLEKKKVCR